MPHQSKINLIQLQQKAQIMQIVDKNAEQNLIHRALQALFYKIYTNLKGKYIHTKINHYIGNAFIS